MRRYGASVPSLFGDAGGKDISVRTTEVYLCLVGGDFYFSVRLSSLAVVEAAQRPVCC